MQPLFAIDYSLLDALVEAIQAHVVAKEYVIVRSRLKDRVQSWCSDESRYNLRNAIVMLILMLIKCTNKIKRNKEKLPVYYLKQVQSRE